MRYQRLILEAGSNAVTVRFHPRLTVVAGVGPGERDMLVTELMGSLSGGRPGAHLELVDDAGRRLALIRPAAGGGDRVLELETGQDVTAEFTAGDGGSDLLARMGLSAREARARCRLTSGDVAAESRGDDLVLALAGKEQSVLWAAAQRLIDADRALAVESRAAGSDVEDAPLIEEIERRHSEFERAQELNDSVRHHGIFIGGVCPPAAAIAKFALHNAVAGFCFLAVAALTTLVSIVFRRRMEKARMLEEDALARAGKESYIGFQIQRIDRMLDGQRSLARVALASEEKRVAAEAWQDLAGDVAPTWAVDHRDEIESAVARRGETVAAASSDANPAQLAHWLAARFTGLRHVGPSGESLPMILDDPLVGVESSVKQWILELIGRSAGSPQVIYLTSDPEVAAWARLEAIAGHLSVLEPAPDAEDTPAMAAAQMA